jgi:hypothetical protein
MGSGLGFGFVSFGDVEKDGSVNGGDGTTSVEGNGNVVGGDGIRKFSESQEVETAVSREKGVDKIAAERLYRSADGC